MSLTSELDYPSSPVRRFIDGQFGTRISSSLDGLPAVTRRRLQTLAIPPQKGPSDVSSYIGMAFDYRVRFYFDKPMVGRLAAHSGAALLEASSSNAAAALAPEFFDDLTGVMDRVNPVGRRLDQADEESVVRRCLVLAYFESVYRSELSSGSPLNAIPKVASLTELLGLPSTAQVADVRDLSWAFFEEAEDLLNQPALCNPVFDGSPDVGGADADLIVGDCLIELKTTKSVGTSDLKGWLRQLLGYTLLDYRDRFGIRRLGIYSARQRCFLTFPLAELLDCREGAVSQGLAELREMFRAALTGEDVAAPRPGDTECTPPICEADQSDLGGEVSEKKVHIDGREVVVRERQLGVDEIQFDEANPRIQFQLDTALTDEPPTQAALGFALTVSNDQYERLRDNVEGNRGVLHPIWVVAEGDSYRVIEGNTRLQVYLDLREKYPSDPTWQRVPACVLPEKCSKEQFHFIRLEAHLFGTTPWDAYEKARYLYLLSTEEDYSLERLSRLTKLTTSDIRSHIQAFRDMKEQYLRSYPEPGEHQKFSYFVEFRKNADLKRLVDAGELSLVDFCNWVGAGKFRRGEDIRRLAAVLRDPTARQQLVNMDFEAALDQLAQRDPGARSPLFDKIEAVIDGVRGMPYSEIDEIKRGRHPRKVELLEELNQVTSNILADLRQI